MNSLIQDQVLDVEGMVMYGDHPDKVVGWLWARNSTDRPAVYVRIGKTGRVIPVSEYLKRAELRGMTKPDSNEAREKAVEDLLLDFAIEVKDASNQAEVTAVYEKASKKIVALFRGEK